jgi:hypothetical protein
MVAGACPGRGVLLGEGQDCLQVTDCELGLACVPVKDGRRVCSRDLSGVTKPYDAGAAAEGGEAGRPSEGGATDATLTDTTPHG